MYVCVWRICSHMVVGDEMPLLRVVVYPCCAPSDKAHRSIQCAAPTSSVRLRAARPDALCTRLRQRLQKSSVFCTPTLSAASRPPTRATASRRLPSAWRARPRCVLVCERPDTLPRSYPDGQTTPTPSAVDFKPGSLIGSVSGELGLRKFLTAAGHKLVITSEKDGPGCQFEKELVDGAVFCSCPFGV